MGDSILVAKFLKTYIRRRKTKVTTKLKKYGNEQRDYFPGTGLLAMVQ
jgi:hypothetical protein